MVAPLVRALGKGGRLLGIHSHGQDPGLEIVQKVWPGENPFTQSRHDLLRATRPSSARDARRYNFNAYADARATFRYDMHTLPTEISASIGTSTLFAAWNAAIYVAQIDDMRLCEALRDTPLPRRHPRRAAKARQPLVPGRILCRFPQARLNRGARRASPELVSAARSRSRRASCTAPREVGALLPADTCVYIPSLPGLPLARTLEAVAAIREAGLDPVPHVSARRILNRDEFRAFLKQAASQSRRASRAS